MKKQIGLTLAGSLLLTTQALAEPCMSDLDGEVYETGGQCEAAIVQKRNEMRQYYDMVGAGADQPGWPPAANTFNEIIRNWLSCEQTDLGWEVVF